MRKRYAVAAWLGLAALAPAQSSKDALPEAPKVTSTVKAPPQLSAPPSAVITTPSATASPYASPCPTYSPTYPAVSKSDEGPSYWGSIDYLLWFVSNSPLPVPLVTRGGSGIPGDPGVTTLFGGQSLDYGAVSGFKLALGGWIDCDRVWGVDASGFFLFMNDKEFSAQSDGAGLPSLAQPVITPGIGPSAYFTSLPGVAYGNLWSTMTFRFYGWEVNGVRNLYRENGLQVDALLGYRSLRLSETLVLNSQLRTLVNGAVSFVGEPVLRGSMLATSDLFGSSTDVYAPQLGAHASFTAEQFTADLVAKVGLGWAANDVAIAGSTSLLPPFGSNLPSRSVAGGLLATSTNIPGGRSSGRFVVVPEVACKVGYDVTEWLRLSVGYSFLYISEVVRPGRQMDPVVNPNNVPSDQDYGRFAGPARPALDISHTSFWAHGVNFGVQLQF